MIELRFRLDKTGFPMVWIEAIGAYLHWIPVTKIQFETFLCAAPDSHFDAAWYEEILSLNSRVSPDQIRLNNYWKAFLSGIKPSEVQRLVRWSGEGYQIPTLQQWFQAYQYLKELLPVANPIPQMGNMKERVGKLLHQLDSTSSLVAREMGYPRTLADQMLMRMGVMEWIEGHGQQYQWGGMGQTHPKFHGILFTPDHGQPRIPNNPEEYRLPYYGFRLLWSQV